MGAIYDPHPILNFYSFVQYAFLQYEYHWDENVMTQRGLFEHVPKHVFFAYQVRPLKAAISSDWNRTSLEV